MKKLSILSSATTKIVVAGALCSALYLTSCNKANDEMPVPASSGETTANRGPQWDVIEPTFTQPSGGPGSLNPNTVITFGTTWSGTSGFGSIFVATCDGSDRITGAWSGPYASSGYTASYLAMMMYATGSQVAITFVPGTTSAPVPASQVGYLVNSTANDHIEVAIVN